jgi:tetrahydromethanopterin S-methyltransferase subunit F
MTPKELDLACEQANRALRFGLGWGFLLGVAVGLVAAAVLVRP